MATINNNGNLDSKIDKLIFAITTLVDNMSVSGVGRGNNNISFTTLRHISNDKDNNGNYRREEKSYNEYDFAKTMTELISQTKERVKTETELVAKLQKEVDEIKKISNDSTKYTDEVKKQEAKLKKDLDDHKDVLTKLINGQKNGSSGIYDVVHQESIDELKKQFANFSDELKKLYGSEEKYVKRKIDEAAYHGESKNRSEAIRDIQQSGLGNTRIARTAQDIIGWNQRVADMGNFATKLNGPETTRFVSALFGGGKTGAVAGKAVQGFGMAIGGASKLLARFAGPIGLAIAAVQLFAEGVSKANEYMTKEIKIQTDLNQLSFQRDVDLTSLGVEAQVEYAKYIGEKQLKMLDLQGQNLIQAIELAAKQFVVATEIAVGPLTEGINATAYKAANAYLDYNLGTQNLNIDKSQREKEYQNFAKRRDVEYGAFVSKNEAGRLFTIAKSDSDMASKAAAYESERIRNWGGRFFSMFDYYNANEANAIDGATYGNSRKTTTLSDVLAKHRGLYNEIGTTSEGKAALEKIGFGGYKEKSEALLASILQEGVLGVDWNKHMADWGALLNTTIAGIEENKANKELEINTKVAKEFLKTNNEVIKMWLSLAQKTEQWLDKYDEVTNNLALSFGFNTRFGVNRFQDKMFSGGLDAAKFGKSYEDLVKIQENYIETIGRNKLFSGSDNRNVMALGYLMGDDSIASSYASEMEIFNSGISESVDLLNQTLNTVTKIGLNGRKFTKTIVDNLKLAQSYNFRGGTKNLMDMARWAENTRFNMSSLGSMLDKVSEGGLEGLITQAAQFQVLGGHSAMNADPLAIMFERYADPSAFAKRMQDMTIGYGSLDRKTGETTFSIEEQMLMQQLAKTQGRSYEDVANEVRARNKRNVIKHIVGGKFDDDKLSYLSNSSFYDRESGTFKVNVDNGRGYSAVSIADVTEDMLNRLMPEEHNERMEEMVMKIVSYTAQLAGAENTQKTLFGQSLNDTHRESVVQRIMTANDNFFKYFDNYVTKAQAAMELANEKFSDYISMWAANEDAQGPGLDKINAATSSIVTALGNTASVIGQANSKISAAIAQINGVINANKTPHIGNNSAVNQQGLADSEEIKRKKGLLVRNAILKGVGNSVLMPLLGPMGPFVSNMAVDHSAIPAKKTTKINDGMVELAQPHKDDTLIAAKNGGPFDKLFNGVFSEVKSIGNYISQNDGPIGGSLKLDSMNININGKLDLSSNGKSIDIMNELRNNPLLLRALTQMLANEISKNMNGGRTQNVISNNFA